MKESWQPVDGYEGLYEVSNRGQVRRVKTGRILRPSAKGPGYPAVSLSEHGKVKTRYIHHLVAFAFIGKRPDGMDINHKDCDKENNAVGNLEYISHVENQRHAVQMGRMSNDNWTRRERNASGHFTSAKASPRPHVAA